MIKQHFKLNFELFKNVDTDNRLPHLKYKFPQVIELRTRASGVKGTIRSLPIYLRKS